MSDQLYLEPNKKLQIGTFLFFIFCIVFPVFFKFLLPQITPDLNSSVEEFKEFHDYLKLLMNGIYLIFVVCILCLSISTICTGILSLKLGCYPPPDAIFPFRIHVYKGKSVIHLSYFSIFIGIFIGILVVIQSFYMIPAINHSFGGYQLTGK